MITNIVSSSFLFGKNVWSVNFLLPQEKIKVGENYTLIPLGNLVAERKESITLTDNDTTVHYIGLENIESKTGRLIDFAIRQGSDIKSTCKVFLVGDILYGRLRPNLNKVLLNENIKKGECSTEILVLIPDQSKVNPVYLSELLRSEQINRRIINMVKGAALPRVSMADLKQMSLPIPPLAEQQRIANIIASKRDELEMHINMAQQIPADISDLITAAYSVQ